MIIKNSRWNKVHLNAGVEYLSNNRDKSHHLTDIQEWGVYRGESLLLLENLFYMHQLGVRQSFGFDSFEGLPAEDPNVEKFYVFTQGAFGDVQKLYPIRGKYVKGWFNELTSEHIKSLDMKPCKFIHIDCDLYISAYQALDFLFANQLAQPYTIIAFDEFKSTSTLMAGGESKAFYEISDKYKIESTEIFRNEYTDRVACWQNTFIINNIGQKSQVKLLGE